MNVRQLLFVAVGFTLLIAAALTEAPAAGTTTASPPRPALSYRVLTLGHRAAAADFVWLRAIQLIGSPRYAQQRFPHLEEWVEVIEQLDPRFQTPPAFVGILLVNEADRAESVDRFLARAEHNAGEKNYYFAMLRGFVAYFGKLDLPAAAVHYRRAAERGGPDYLGKLADRLATRVLNCSDLASDLALAANQDSLEKDPLRRNAQGIVVNCVEEEIKTAAQRYQLTQGQRAASVETLVEAGYLKDLPEPPPGMCWRLVGIRGKLTDCSSP